MRRVYEAATVSAHFPVISVNRSRITHLFLTLGRMCANDRNWGKWLQSLSTGCIDPAYCRVERAIQALIMVCPFPWQYIFSRAKIR